MLAKILSHQWFGNLKNRPATNNRIGARSHRAYQLESLEKRMMLDADPIISEFMADNDNTLLDGDGNASDWIEIFNAGDQSVNLLGYHLTDDAGDFTQWTFPSVDLLPGEHLVVFASGQPTNNFVDAGGNLHTNFKLSAGGEYLGLIEPDNTTIATEFSPEYPEQQTDVSYGTANVTADTTLLSGTSAAKILVPTVAPELPADWNTTSFVDSAWTDGQAAIGFDTLLAEELVNVAPQGIASQSTINGGFSAGLANDGSFAEDNFTHTVNTDPAPMWQLDLGDDFEISSLVLYNRANCCQERLRDITVTIRDADDTTDLFVSDLLNPENALFGPATLTLDLEQLTGGKVTGGIIRITRTRDDDSSGIGANPGNADDASVISLQEVEVFATPKETSVVNVAPQGTATQSTTNGGFTASLGIDGSTGNFTHTLGTDAAASWRLDLPNDFEIDNIVIFNRGDGCCFSRLRDITVRIRDAADTQDLYVSPLLNPENIDNGPGQLNIDLVQLTGDVVTGGIIIIERTPDPDLSGTGGAGNADEANVLSLGEVRVNTVISNSSENIAAGKPVTQSTTLAGFPASFATDENLGNFTHTFGSDTNTFLMVDLEEVHSITQVNLHNRDSCCGSRLRDITMEILDINQSVIWQSVLLNPENILGTFPNGPDVISLDIETLNGGAPVFGQFIRVTRTSDPDLSGTAGQGNVDEANVLSLGEVEVFGSRVPFYTPHIITDLVSEMENINSSAFLRIPFDVADLAAIDLLTLQMKYDDGFAAYLNGTEVARINAVDPLLWDSTATTEHPDIQAIENQSFNLTQYISLLQATGNVLAIQGLNLNAADDDFLIVPELIATNIVSNELRFMDQPTPGVLNGEGILGFVADINFDGDVNDFQGRGFYDTAFDVTISSATPGATIVYTTDGSIPTETNGTVVLPADNNTPPSVTLNIAQTSILRATALKTDFQPTNVDTQTYLFLADIFTQQADGSAPIGWPSAPVNGQVFDYGVDPDIINQFSIQELTDSFTQIPSLSLTTDIANLVDPTTGIYVNAQGRGKEWERPVSVELINPDGTPAEGPEFQIDAGLRIRGGASRGSSYVKHSFRLFFRDEYGASKLRVPIFGPDGIDEIDSLDLRTAQNYSWAKYSDFGTGSQNTLVREVFSRDTQGETGQPTTSSRYYHLYLNGQYWGIYQTQERPEAGYGEAHFGGEKEDYDVVKTSNHIGGFTTEVTDGNFDAWFDFWTQGNTIANDPSLENYMKIQGLNPDGTRNLSYPVQLDADNLIDYMLTIFYSGDGDAPLSSFLGNNRANNWFGLKNRNSEEGWRFFRHDAEHTHGTGNSQTDRTGPFTGSNENSFTYSNPQWIYQDLLASDEFRLRVADRIHEHFFNEGAMTDDVAIANFIKRATQIDDAIIGQSARWGDAQRPTAPFTQQDWQNEIDSVIASDLPGRSATVFQQLVNDSLYPNTAAPEFFVNNNPQHGGNVFFGDVLTLTQNSAPSFTETEILSLGGSADFFVPQNADFAGDSSWNALGFDVSSAANPWGLAGTITGPTAVGYDTGDGSYLPLLSTGTDVSAQIPALGSSLFVRQLFDFDGTTYDRLQLQMQYDDGFIAYINGVEVARSNNIGDTSNPSTSLTTSDHEANGSFDIFDIDLNSITLNVGVGTNVLAIHGMNTNTTSSDMIFAPKLVGGVLDPSPVLDAIYFTTDGSDPRLIGGAMNPLATVYSGQIILITSEHIIARTFDSGSNTWSAVSETSFFVEVPLRVTELMYNPAVNEQEEYIELINTSGNTIVLAGIRFDGSSEGIEFTFDNTEGTLGPNDRIVVVRNQVAFDAAYDTAGMRIAIGQYNDGGQKLSNDGEELTLLDSVGGIIQQFTYNDIWYKETDGDGFSLIVKDTNGDYNDPANWRSSALVGGSPSTQDDTPLFADFNGSGTVDATDLAILLENYGTASGAYRTTGDATGDGKVSLQDLLVLKKTFGETVSAPPASAAAALTVSIKSPLPTDRVLKTELNSVPIVVTTPKQLENPATKRTNRSRIAQAVDQIYDSSSFSQQTNHPVRSRLHARRGRRIRHELVQIQDEI